MRAMILAAGRGERMRPLSDTTPKPLLEVHGKPLIVHHIDNLSRAGIKEIVINVAHLGEQIMSSLGDGGQFGVSIAYSDEREEGGLETAGGIKKALPLLGEKPFVVVNGDIFTSYMFQNDLALHNKLAHLILVPNPPQHLEGDFALHDGLARNVGAEKYTFSGIGYYEPKLFSNLPDGKAPLAPLLRKAMEKELISAELFNNLWHDIGTPQRLKEINDEK